jgi:hypothetical protein
MDDVMTARKRKKKRQKKREERPPPRPPRLYIPFEFSRARARGFHYSNHSEMQFISFFLYAYFYF